MKKLSWHLGVGDAITFAGLVIQLSNGEDLEVPCWDHNLISVKSIFCNHKNIHVVSVQDESGFNERDIKLGYFNQDLPPKETENHIDWIFRQAGYNSDERWQYDPITTAASCVTQQEYPKHAFIKYAFYHFDYNRGFIINQIPQTDDLIVVTPTNKHSPILSYADTLKYASEIHVIDSSFLHLTEAIETTGTLFWHKYARPYTPLSNYRFRKKWTILN